MEWALTLQLALVAIPWPEDLLACEQAAIVLHPETDQVLFRGLRCRVGIYAGPIDRVTPHPKTGRADYFGQVCAWTDDGNIRASDADEGTVLIVLSAHVPPPTTINPEQLSYFCSLSTALPG